MPKKPGFIKLKPLAEEDKEFAGKIPLSPDPSPHSTLVFLGQKRKDTYPRPRKRKWNQ